MTSVRLETPTKLAAYKGTEPVGTLSFFRNRFHYHPHVYSVAFSDFATGIDAASVARSLYDRLVRELHPKKPLLLRTGVDEGDAFYSVLRSLGFRDYRRVYCPTLDGATFDLELFRDAEAAFQALGYDIVQLSDLNRTAEIEAKLYALHCEVYTDTSTVVPATPEQFSQAEWLKETVRNDAVIPEAFFIALKDDGFVGFGNLFQGEVEDELETGTFGTRRTHRHHHREIMLALKAREVAYAKERGYATIRAEIDAENPWILHVCAELPFVQGKDHLSMVRVMNWSVAAAV